MAAMRTNKYAPTVHPEQGRIKCRSLADVRDLDRVFKAAQQHTKTEADHIDMGRHRRDVKIQNTSANEQEEPPCGVEKRFVNKHKSGHVKKKVRGESCVLCSRSAHPRKSCTRAETLSMWKGPRTKKRNLHRRGSTASTQQSAHDSPYTSHKSRCAVKI